jgi:hypothetical protein
MSLVRRVEEAHQPQVPRLMSDRLRASVRHAEVVSAAAGEVTEAATAESRIALGVSGLRPQMSPIRSRLRIPFSFPRPSTSHQFFI